MQSITIYNNDWKYSFVFKDLRYISTNFIQRNIQVINYIDAMFILEYILVKRYQNKTLKQC